jgi:hypothetical protein
MLSSNTAMASARSSTPTKAKNMIGFNQLRSALRKQEDSLTDDEAETVRALTENQAISPAFVERLVREHGCGAIGRAYLIRSFQQTPHLAWLLRRFKGKFYRTRYVAETVSA